MHQWYTGCQCLQVHFIHEWKYAGRVRGNASILSIYIDASVLCIGKCTVIYVTFIHRWMPRACIYISKCLSVLYICKHAIYQSNGGSCFEANKGKIGSGTFAVWEAYWKILFFQTVIRWPFALIRISLKCNIDQILSEQNMAGRNFQRAIPFRERVLVASWNAKTRESFRATFQERNKAEEPHLVSRRVRASHDTDRILDNPPIVLRRSLLRLLSSAAVASPPPSPPLPRGELGADPLAPAAESASAFQWRH